MALHSPSKQAEGGDLKMVDSETIAETPLTGRQDFFSKKESKEASLTALKGCSKLDFCRTIG